MTKFKCLISLISAAAISAALSFASFAAVTGSITIKNPEAGHTYTAYLLFDATCDDASGSTAYQADEEKKAYYEALDANPFAFTEMAASEDYAVSIKDDESLSESDVTDFIEQLVTGGTAEEMITLGLISEEGSVTSGSTDAVTITPLPYGYYYVTSTMGSLVAIDTAAPDTVIEEKNAAPTLEKLVSSLENGTYSSSNRRARGSTEYFRITITVSAGASGYVLHDSMDDGLEFDESSLAVTADGTGLTEGTEYTLITGDSITDDCTFEVVFSEDWLGSVSVGTEIVITYSALVAKSATTSDNGNLNTAELTYGQDSEWTTGSSTTVTNVSSSSGSSSGGSGSSSSTGLSAYSSGTGSDSSSSGSSSDGSDHDSGTSWNDPHKLPQTGQLNWPVPVLASLGLVLMLAGYVLIRDDERRGSHTEEGTL